MASPENLFVRYKHDQPYEWDPVHRRLRWAYRASRGLLHHKTLGVFVDGVPTELVCGSFNWTRKAASSYENLLILSAGDAASAALMWVGRTVMAISVQLPVASRVPLTTGYSTLDSYHPQQSVLKPQAEQRQTACMRYISAPQRSHTILSTVCGGEGSVLPPATVEGRNGRGGSDGPGCDMPRIIAYGRTN